MSGLSPDLSGHVSQRFSKSKTLSNGYKLINGTMHSNCEAMMNNAAIVVVAALAASLSLADAASSYRCTFEDSASLHGARRFTIRTRHRNRIMKGE